MTPGLEELSYAHQVCIHLENNVKVILNVNVNVKIMLKTEISFQVISNRNHSNMLIWC